MSIQRIPENSDAPVAGFISKTFEILNNQEYSKIIHWGPSGKQFVIKDTNKFQDIVLPHYFRHRKMNSFVRQLNMYGFHKSRKDNSKCIFSHPSFVKDGEDLLITIKRKIKEPEAHIETPIKSKQNCFKSVEETCLKEVQEKKPFQEIPVLSSFMQNRERVNSFLDLNLSVKKFSANNFDILEDNIEDQNVSIVDEIEQEQQRKAEKLNILNPSFFFCSFNSVNLN